MTCKLQKKEKATTPAFATAVFDEDGFVSGEHIVIATAVEEEDAARVASFGSDIAGAPVNTLQQQEGGGVNTPARTLQQMAAATTTIEPSQSEPDPEPQAQRAASCRIDAISMGLPDFAPQPDDGWGSYQASFITPRTPHRRRAEQ